MYVYLFAPTLLLLAVILGWGPKQIPLRALGWFLGVDLLLSIIDYFAGIFPPINVPTLLYFLLVALLVRGVRILIERSAGKLMKNRTLLIVGGGILALVILTVFSFGGLLTIGILIFSLMQNRKPRGPRPISQAGGFGATYDQARKSLQKLGPLSLLVTGTAVALLLSGVIASASTTLAAGLTYGEQVSLVKAKTTATLPPIQVGDVPIVEKDSASLVMANAIGTLGPQYHVSLRGLSLVRYQGQLYWTSPLDYNNGLIWLTRHSTPGFVLMQANNPSAKPLLSLNEQINITPAAGFSWNLGRLLYQHFPTLIIGTSDWEIDPSGKGYWVTSLYAPAPGLGSLVTRVLVGSALVDPTSGHITYYALGTQPAWVSQVVGPNFAQSEAARFGWDRAGLIASTFTHQLATKPVHATPYNVLLGNGGLGWEIPMTSPNPGDNSLSGIILVNAETNAVTFTPFTGLQNDLAISQRIDGSTLNSTLSSGRALLYNVAGSLAYVAPVVNQSGIVQQVAIVDPKNVAQPVIASNLIDALSAWQAYLAGNGQTNPQLASTTVKTSGVVTRVATLLQSSGANASTVKEYWLFLVNGQAYRASQSLDPTVVPFVQPGDHVILETTRGATSPATLLSIRDLTLSGAHH
ncbi:hypothetical protein [Ferroacidibacillus organovorans]|uniref:Uncharacterized protein n=1 Tax=Ferroacidibacillus organovorans TaxID=1765683 RepID=A0A162SRS4_9BACL|nr:hypothetical protein [Ferroacidibacillus organovorans]KYP80090.1 hypothetical protein AYJ22_12385 [Ferroacidibacillus organovorans]OAG93121.1 hypothetical protein AYW79_12255 [Ferroacidibacillus organovorans]OPG15556.1 hypothetical protein B2M26_10795 [Ferroacidibacillus organovorans]